jgi:hypothetical protein
MLKKILKPMLVIILIIVFAELCLLGYIKSSFINNSNSTIKATIISINNKISKYSSHSKFKSTLKNKGGIVHLPKNISGIKVSQSNDFIAYVHNNKLFVMNLLTLKGHTVNNIIINARPSVLINKNNSIPPFYDWIPERNVLMIGLSNYAKKKSNYKTLKILFYDAENNKSASVLDFDNIQTNRYITSIKNSPITNVTYFKIDGNNDISGLYRVGQNGDKDTIKNSSFYIKEMFLLKSQDKLFFNGVNPDGIYSVDAKSLKNSRLSENNEPSYFLARDYTAHKILTNYNFMKVLGITKNDKVIIAHFSDNNTIDKLYSYDSDLDKLTPINLNIEKVKSDHLFVSADGDIYLLYKNTNKLINIFSNKTIYYKGTLLKVSNNCVFSILKNTLYIQHIHTSH